MSKKTIDERIHNHDVKAPAGWLYPILMVVCKIINSKLKTSFSYKEDPRKEAGPIVLISNHASRNDYLFTAPAVYPKKLNYVVGYNEFFRFPLNIVLKLMGVIPKKNFTPDLYTVRQVLKVIKRGGNICFMPEGMSSITGMAQPVITGSAKLLKKLGVPVYYTKISGGYLTYTKHCLDERPGKCEVVVDRMFTKEELASMTEDEITDTMNRLLAHDDYMWNKEAKVKFKCKGGRAQKLSTLLYMCPKCRGMYTNENIGDRMRCKACGNEIEVDEYYQIHAVSEDSVCPEYITDWTIMEREAAKEEVSKPDFVYSGHMKVGVLPDYKRLKGDNTSIICGEGDLTLDHNGLHFKGILKGKDYSFDMKSDSVLSYGMCTDISRFYTFVDGSFIEFYPEKEDVLRWDHLTEEMHRINGGKWQNTAYRHI